ncbi:MAG TPA: HD domain-containing phosphohydrolase [Humidesulfovibrio sp.]|uniref:HD domain-containing phosphohydrolase n=1 Tax=Humidesulfovibrio sp. TaxID=2910988 RepID=UPI002C71FB6C|nr:HD domain-containing phosphohydrolase [Humidesulfovibrio sp.]HWR04988.1 HD domain-containing phosphohydrolase [Humidesulfovibrio sp.]
MPGKILMVEAAANPLGNTQERLAQRFDLHCAIGVEEALKAVRANGPFDVVLTDLRLGKKDGLALLAAIRIAHPQTVGLVMVQRQEVDLALNAVEDGKAYRVVVKPASVDGLTAHLNAGLEQFKLQTAEQSFLQDTLHGAIQALTDVLSLANPAAFGRALRIRGLVHRLSKAILIPQFWEVDMAAMLSHIGCVSLPKIVLDKIAAGKDLAPDERKLFDTHPTIGAGVLANIPRMALVAEIIKKQHARFDATPPFGARVLKVVLDYDMLLNRGLPAASIFTQMAGVKGVYDPEILAAFESTIPVDTGYVRKRVTMRDLKANMILEESIVSVDGMLLLAKDAELNENNIYRLIESTRSFEIVEPVTVLVPVNAL